MINIFKSDLTYSIFGGFMIGALALFLTTLAVEQQQLTQNISSLVTATQGIFS